ncbi:class I SAM-dependent methyltransferase [Haliangium ochraceum]|uniref:Methyltransferase type 11 n=1 Tax=Haliangium ochraceum (strain DSM 14365 / JCM 11303 / SMP-2) TaxID=502025 RepID=D0LWX8_HALO1|nr:class I SAM-dependent methyltransferase [Haliangium ochraceum]ACY14225.1 Methyltransferase type 11 [Haliangium ochraceum DSM 14365]
MNTSSDYAEIVAHYENANEEQRLHTSFGQLELVRSQQIIQRYLDPNHKRIADIGGGTGIYALWLAAQGYDVSLLDPVERHVELARESAEQAGLRLASVDRGDARALPYDDASMDVALMMGPLYHLTTPAERVAALREAHRVLAPGGVLIGVGIGRYASLLIEGLVMGFIDEPSYVDIITASIESGIHRNDDNRPYYFTTAVFLLPETLEGEFAEAGFRHDSSLPVEGPCWMAKDFDARWQDQSKRATLLTLLEAVEDKRALLTVSPHFMVIGRK